MTTIHITTTAGWPPSGCSRPATTSRRGVRRSSPPCRSRTSRSTSSTTTSADVTEGTPAGVGINWERCRYDWSQPGSVKAMVTNSNVYQPARSSWELRATPSRERKPGRDDLDPRIHTDTRGRIFGTLFKLIGKPIFRRYVRDTLENLRRLEQTEVSRAGVSRSSLGRRSRWQSVEAGAANRSIDIRKPASRQRRGAPSN